ncbi:MAG: glycoside hydrolase family 88 protein, partial [Prevotella sp.]|nr:glycoside hydrolase family 88 protein [Prevotella sp.]
INLDYEPNELCCRDYPPTVRNVYMENVTCQKSKYGIMAVGLQDVCNVYNVNLKNCQFNGVTDEPVYKTGQMRDFYYDGLKINGKVVLDKPTYAHYSEWMTHSEMARVNHPYMLDFAKKPKWSYVMGIEMEGMLDTYLTYKDNAKNSDIITYLHEYAKEMINDKGDIQGYKIEDYNLDQIRTGKYILRMEQLFPEAKNKLACDLLWSQLQNQPRTKQGVWFHKAIYANQVWLDGIFMGLPFYCNYATVYLPVKKANKIYDDAVKQVTTTDKFTFDEKTQLWKHAWDEKHSIFWANKETGLSQHTWARAQGWYAMALVEILDAMPQDYAKRQEVIDLLAKVLKNTVAYQDKKSGVWYDVLDVNSPKNYLEATASSMFAYCLLKAARLGYVDDDMKQAGIKAYKGIINEFIKINDDKTISLTNCCSVSGLGPESNPKRDGSFEYYMSEPIRDNDAKGVGPFIWASLEMERMGYDVEKLTQPQKKANHNNY